MPERAYTVAEIDRMRDFVERRWLFGDGPISTSPGASRPFKEIEKTTCVEEILRTYMLTGLEPDEVCRENTTEVAAPEQGWPVDARMRDAIEFTLKYVFDPPHGWYSDKAFPYLPDETMEEQLARGRDTGPVYVSEARERLRRALGAT